MPLNVHCDFDPDAPKVTIKGAPQGNFSVTSYISHKDGAIVIEIDTTFEPDEAPLRVWLNDYEMR